MRRTLQGVAIALFGALAVAVPTAQGSTYGPISQSPGHVKSACAGSMQAAQPIRHPATGAAIGWLYLYYSSASNGTNCVIVTNNYGQVTRVRAELRVKSDGNKSTNTPYQTYWDEGYYASYAGAVYATNTNGRCVSQKGTIWFPGGYSTLQSSWGHCG